MNAEKQKGSIILEIAVLFLIGMVLTGVLTYFSETRHSDGIVAGHTEQRAAQIADEVMVSVREYPAWPWLIEYWYENSGTLDIEYDADFKDQSRTLEKCRVFSERHPALQLRYLTEADCAALPPEDQKLYAEICYSWLTTRVDQIKRAYQVDYLFCVVTEAPYERQFFLFSAADPGMARGTSYEEVYPIGNTVSVGPSQSEAMREAVMNASHLADAGNYVDYYARFYDFGEHSALIGLTYDLSALTRDAEKEAVAGTKLAILSLLVLSLTCLALILGFVVRPLKKVQESIRQYKLTKDSAAVTAALTGIPKRNEIGHLAVDVSDMVREIDAHMREIQSITAEKQRIDTELNLAARIQAAMLPGEFPPFPERREFDIYASMDPAKEVGGDFYDFFLIDEDHLALAIADVSGKGVPAALFMMVSKILVNNYAENGLSPAKTLEAVNRQICTHNTAEMFVTVWFGILEISSGRLTAANAGHEYPVLRTPGGSFELLKDRHGLVVGAMENARYRDYELQLQPGAKLFVYTDGVPEATSAEKELFGTERLVKALNTDPNAEPEELLHHVRRAVDSFVKDAEQFDDLTMLCLSYHGPLKEGETL